MNIYNNLYKSLLKEKIFFNDINIKKIENEKNNFFFNIFKQNKNFSKRKDIDNINCKCIL